MAWIADVCFFDVAYSPIQQRKRNRMTALEQFLPQIISVAGILWGVYVYRQSSKQTNAERRSKYLEDLLAKFTDNKIRRIVCAYDSPDGCEEVLRKAKVPNSEEALQLEQSLMDIAYLCYLKKKNEISKDEFCFFKNDIIAVLSIPAVQTYINEHICAEGDVQEENHFRYLISFMVENEIEGKARPGRGEVRSADEDGVAACGGNAGRGDGPIRESDFDMPTMIIKINRKYEALRNGSGNGTGEISDEAIYEAVRGSWRVNLENAKKYKVVLAVADGNVCGVYLVDKWENAKEEMRYQFTRRIDPAVEERERKRFMGRSVRDLFPRGASNPIRYYAGCGKGLADVE